MEFNKELIGPLVEALAEYFPTKSDLDKVAAEMVKRGHARATGEDAFSITRAFRGVCAMQGHVLNADSKDEDVNYAKENLSKALTTGSTPGSYLVPTIQANEIISLLNDAGALRKIGPRVWPMPGIEKLTVPSATATPTVEWLGENTAQTASDPTLGQVSFDLKTARALIAIPNELLRVSTPAVDAIVQELLAIGFGNKEDAAFFSTTTQTGGPGSVYAASSTTTLLVSGSANGGDLAYSDLYAVLEKAYTAKAQPPFVWAMHPRTFFSRVLGMVDLNSRPIVSGDSSLANEFGFRLLGFPVVISSNIPVDQTNGSGSAQSYILFTNPKYLHIGDQGSIEIAFSGERYFDQNQTAIRGVRRLDYGYAPPAGIVILQGVN